MKRNSQLYCAFLTYLLVVMGALGRTNHLKEPTDRVADTFHDIGMSITLTTITSTAAFGLGCLSTIPVSLCKGMLRPL